MAAQTDQNSKQVTSQWVRETAPVLAHTAGGRDWYVLTLQSPQVAARALPGQFVQIAVPTGTAGAPIDDPLLRRPLSLCTIEPAADRIRVIYRVVGRGTALLSAAVVGQRLDVLGPLGRSFPDPSLQGGALLLIGGGLGIPPLACAGAWAAAAGRSVTAVLGARHAGDLAGIAQVQATGVPVHVLTEDGGAGRRGRVTDGLEQRLRHTAEVWACGPEPMLAAIQSACLHAGTPCWLSMERPMACGFGVCAGCSVPKAADDGYLKACVDGPVFAANVVRLMAANAAPAQSATTTD